VVSPAHALRDWCLISGTGASYIEPGSPWQNPWIESFKARLRDELLDTELFSSLAEAKLILAEWLEGYNSSHPHSSLGCCRRLASRRPGGRRRGSGRAGWLPPG
jgi:putative transposase